MRCAYCAESLTQPKRKPMEPAMVNLAIERLFEWSWPGSALSIHFGSGEPLLNPAVVKLAGTTARRMARKQKRPLSLHLTTNGTVLTPAISRWLIDGGWEVKVSLDGPRTIHDRYRRRGDGTETYAAIAENVRTLSSLISHRLSATAVLCRGADPAKVFYGIARLGIRQIETVPVVAPAGSSFLPGEADFEAYRRFICDYARRAVRSRSLPLNIRFRKRLQRIIGLGNSQIACGAGRNFFAVASDGAFYPCFRFVGIDDFRLGDLSSGFDGDAVRRFSLGPGRPYGRRKECQRCWAAPLCDGPCFACVELIGDGAPSPGFCETTRADCEAALWLADVLREKNAEKLARLVGIELGI
jgi:uncharacterized protein